ncbi:MAG: hypothetical protein ACI9K2_007206, partial [Myxococcota bacterium]
DADPSRFPGADDDPGAEGVDDDCDGEVDTLHRDDECDSGCPADEPPVACESGSRAILAFPFLLILFRKRESL